MPSDTKPKILLLIYPDFTEFEIAIATTLLARRYHIVTVAPATEIVTSEGGLQIVPHATLDQIDPADYAALLVSAAPDMQSALDNSAISALIQAMDAQGKLIAAICGAPMLLGKAGILRDREYTVSLYRRYRDFLGFFPETTFRNQPVVESDNLITAQGYAYAEFGLRVAARLDAVRDSAGAQAYYRGQGDIYWDAEEAKTEL